MVKATVFPVGTVGDLGVRLVCKFCTYCLCQSCFTATPTLPTPLHFSPHHTPPTSFLLQLDKPMDTSVIGHLDLMATSSATPNHDGDGRPHSTLYLVVAMLDCSTSVTTMVTSLRTAANLTTSNPCRFRNCCEWRRSCRLGASNKRIGPIECQ
jgi:hypothetical protein